MSSSSSAAAKGEKEDSVHPFPYADATQGAAATPAASAASGETRETQLREAALREGEARARLAYDEQLEKVRNSIRTALLDFEREKAAYFQKVEPEVVRLALSIARKVLHREAQMDPLLLAGIVRVALEQIEGNTRVVVRVHPLYGVDCRAYLARNMDSQEVPEVEEDPSLEVDQCVLQTDLGSTELGIEVQLKEIEQGLMDLLAQRPAAKG